MGRSAVDGTSRPRRFGAVILAGGRARRMGGIDKTALEVGGATLLRRAVDAARTAEIIVIVGPRRDLDPASGAPVLWTQEDPPGGGPVAAVAAGIEFVGEEAVVVLSADLPEIDAAAVASLVEGLGDDATLAVDGSGRDQYLCAAYRTPALRAALSRVPQLSGAPMKALVDGLRVARLRLGAKAADIDTPEDLERHGDGLDTMGA